MDTEPSPLSLPVEKSKISSWRRRLTDTPAERHGVVILVLNQIIGEENNAMMKPDGRDSLNGEGLERRAAVNARDSSSPAFVPGRTSRTPRKY